VHSVSLDMYPSGITTWQKFDRATRVTTSNKQGRASARQEVLISLADIIVSTLVLFSFLCIRNKVDLMRYPTYLYVPFSASKTLNLFSRHLLRMSYKWRSSQLHTFNLLQSVIIRWRTYEFVRY
jgi:hypothetical protein